MKQKKNRWLLVLAVLVFASGVFLAGGRLLKGQTNPTALKLVFDSAAEPNPPSMKASEQAKEFFFYFSSEFDFALTKKKLPMLYDVFLHEVLCRNGEKAIIVSTDMAAENIIVSVPVKRLKNKEITKKLAQRIAVYVVEYITAVKIKI